eukprot:scaffold20461_cov117-Cylindrotheca_fusiformis.AAC.15
MSPQESGATGVLLPCEGGIDEEGLTRRLGEHYVVRVAVEVVERPEIGWKKSFRESNSGQKIV